MSTCCRRELGKGWDNAGSCYWEGNLEKSVSPIVCIFVDFIGSLIDVVD
jgi:hypothetical protein